MSILEGPGARPDDRVVITVEDTALTRSELFATAAAVADRVQGATSAALEARSTVDTVAAVVGCLLAGVPAVPVPPDSGPCERDHILTDSAAQVWIGAPPDGVTLDAVPVGDRSPSRWDEPADGTALILYTSGTTGPPKGVPISRRAIRACLDGLADAWAWTPDDTLVHGLPLFHVHGLVLGVLGPLRIGSPLVHTGRPTPAAYAAAGGTLYFGVPTIWSRITAAPSAARALRGARLLVSGSAGLPEPVHAALRSLCGHGPLERYGMTETLITLAMRADGTRRPGWVGGPIAGVGARLVDDAGAPTPGDGVTIGELEVAGPTVFDGYVGDAGASRKSFTEDGWFPTGDAAVATADGEYRIIGRARDDLISSGGYRIGAGEIEASLLRHRSVTEAAVVGVADPDLGQRIVAYVVGPDADGPTLIEHVAHDLSFHKRPREVRIVESLPRNAMGKVQKAALR